jgi:hypothetical protein
VYKTDHPIRVCSGLDNHCIDSTDVVDVLTVSFRSKNNKYSIKLTCRISLSGPVELIIGRDSIKKHKFVSLLPNLFFNEDMENNERDKPDRHFNCSIAPFGYDIDAKAAAFANKPDNGLSPMTVDSDHHSRNKSNNRVHFDDIPLIGNMEVASPLIPSDTPSQTWGPIATILKQNEQLSEVKYIVSNEIDSDKKDTFGPFREPDSTTEQILDAAFLSRIVIEGTPELQQGIKTLLIESKDTFSDKLKAKSADIPLCDLEVDKKSVGNIPQQRSCTCTNRS